MFRLIGRKVPFLITVRNSCNSWYSFAAQSNFVFGFAKKASFLVQKKTAATKRAKFHRQSIAVQLEKLCLSFVEAFSYLGFRF